MKLRIPKKPAIPKSIAIVLPSFAAIAVARRRPNFGVNRARSTRPPSIGKDGSKLKPARKKFSIPSVNISCAVS